ncbi:head GIN domain-containing protein [Chloroflexus aurantiacus]
MKQLIVWLLVFVVALSACSFTPPGAVTGSGNMVTQTFDVRAFDQIRLGTSGMMYIEQGDNFSLSIEADDNILPVLQVEVEKGVLTLRTIPEVSMLQSETLIYRVTLPKLSALDLSGSADIHADDFTADSLDININGSGDVTFVNLDVASLSVRISGSGDMILPNVSAKTILAEVNSSGLMEVAGTTDRLHVKVSGSGDVLAENLKASIVEVAVNGSGDVTVWAVDTLDVSISGSGNVRYLGSPALTEKISGGGDLSKLDS